MLCGGVAMVAIALRASSRALRKPCVLFEPLLQVLVELTRHTVVPLFIVEDRFEKVLSLLLEGIFVYCVIITG